MALWVHRSRDLQRHSWTRGDSWALAVLIIAAAAFHFIPYEFMRREAIHIYDDTIYIAGARSLADGEGYRFSGFLNAPRIGFYPPIQSALMALVWKVFPKFPENLPWLNAQTALFALAGYAGAFVFWQRMGLPLWLRVLLLAGWAFSPTWNVIVCGLMTDVGFTALTLLLLLCWLKWETSNPLRAWLVVGIGMAVGYWWRTAALAILGGLFMIAAWRAFRRREFMPLACIGVPAFVSVVGWKLLAPPTIGYWGILKALWDDIHGWGGYLRMLLGNASSSIQGLPFYDAWFNGGIRLPEIAARWGPVAGGFAGGLAILFFWGLVACMVTGWRRVRSPFHEALAVLIGIYCVQLALLPYAAWHYHRYVLPLIPILVVWMWHGMRPLIESRWGTWAAPLLAVSLALNAAGNAYFLQAHFRFRAQVAQQHLAELKEISAWIRANTVRDARIGVDFSLPVQQLFVATGRPLVIDYLCSKDPLTPLRPSDLGFPRAHYILLQKDCASELPEGLLEIAVRSSRETFRLFRVDSVKEAEWRRVNRFPEERVATAGGR